MDHGLSLVTTLAVGFGLALILGFFAERMGGVLISQLSGESESPVLADTARCQGEDSFQVQGGSLSEEGEVSRRPSRLGRRRSQDRFFRRRLLSPR